MKEEGETEYLASGSVHSPAYQRETAVSVACMQKKPTG